MNPPPVSCSSLQWASVLSQVAMEQERMLPVLQDLLRTNNDLELRSLTGFLRNLSRHARDKNDFCKYPTELSPPPLFHELFQTTSSLLSRSSQIAHFLS